MKRIIAIMLALLLMIPTGITAMAAGKTIMSVNLPVSQTDFYTDAAIESPVFYSSLECVINSKTVTVDGFTWTCSNYASDTAGTYVFSAVAPSGYTFGCTVPTITVNMKSGGPSSRATFFTSKDYTGQRIAFKAAADDDTANRFYDRTGFNELRPAAANTPSNLNVVAGIDYKKTMTKSTVADVALYDATVTSVRGGSYGTNFIGTSNIYIDGGSISEGLYAGSVNGTFEGTTNIYLSGSPSIFLIMCGGHYDYNALNTSYGAIVGSEDITYNGTVNIYIAEDYAGDITNIDFRDADEINFYIAAGADFDTSRYQMSRPNVNVYIDGVNYDLVTQVDHNGAEFVIGELGTAEKDVITDDITVYVDDKELVLSDITWESDDYSASTEGVYTFKPVLPDNYHLATGVELPEVDVLVANSGSATINSVTYANETVIPDGISVSELDMPDTVTAELTVNGGTYTYDIPATFTSQNYKTNAGTYSFALSVDDVFASTSLPALEVTVSEDASVTRSGDVYTVDSTGVRISGERTEEYTNYMITDVAGIYTYYDNVDVINTIYAKGNDVKIVIDSDAVYICNKIDLNDTSGKVTLDIPRALVTRVRYDSGIAGYVYINGVQMSTYINHTASVNSNATYLYANGIPSIVACGEDGGTYLYRANDMSLLYDGDMEELRIYGGGQKGTTVESTNIAFMSGYLGKIFAGGDGTVKDATLVVDGGAASYFRGGGTNGSVTLKTTVIIEDGMHRENVMAGGEAGSVMGDSTKTYSDDEFTNEIHMYGGAFSYLYLGSTGEVYGNVKLVQHGGELVIIASSGLGMIYGNVDITVYDGFWETKYVSKNFTGKSTLRLYKSILRYERSTYPYITGDPGNVTYFGHAEDFEYIRYTDNRSNVISTADDKGKLVIRFLETRLPGHYKYKQRNYSANGDIIYITFPNGQNMLMDTGVHVNYVSCIATLKEMGVTKLDYVLITHEHGDHMGAIQKLASTFPIGTFILQKLDSAPDWKITNAIKENDSEVLYAQRGDWMMIGDVEIYALNPANPIQSLENVASMATVLTYGDSKVLLGADTYEETEKDWLSNEEILEKIKDCDVLKLGHHGYFTSSYYKYIDHVNPDKVIMTNMNEYGVCVSAMAYQLMNVNGINRNDFSVIGQNGLIKVTLDGTGNTPIVEQEYVRIEPYYADYGAVDDIIEAYDSYDGTLSEEDIEEWEEAVNLIESNLLYKDQAVVDGMAEHLGKVFARITSDIMITATDLTGYETKTVFPAGIVTSEPQFYSTIPATVGGIETDLEVRWVCTDKNEAKVEYDGTAIGTTYYFRAEADGYSWECDVPVIEVKIVHAKFVNNAGRVGFSSTTSTEPIEYVIKGTGTDKPNEFYDATGCIKIDSGSYGSDAHPVGAHNFSGAVTTESSKVTVDGTTVATVFGGGFKVNHNADTNVIIKNSTVTYDVYGGGRSIDEAAANVTGTANITITDSSVTNIYGGGYAFNNPAAKADAVSANINISGNVTIANIYGGGNEVLGSAKLTGITTVNIHDLTEGSTIKSIKRNNATNLVVYLDDTSAKLLSAVENLDTDRNTQVYVNGKLYVPAADYSEVEEAIALIPADLSVYTDESVAELNSVKDAVDYNLTGYDQETVDGYATAIKAAVANLRFKYIVEVGTTTDTDYVGTTKLILVYTDVADITFNYRISEEKTVKMFDVSGAGYMYNDKTKYTYVYGLVVEGTKTSETEGVTPLTYDEFCNNVTVDNEKTEKIDYSVPYDINFNGTLEYRDIISIYAVAEHDADIFVNEYMKQIIKADTNRDKIVRSNDTDKLFATFYGG